MQYNLQSLLDSLHDGVYFVDRQRRITYWNPAAERITGYLAGEVIGSSCADNILMHVDQAGTNLCTGHCPLAQTMEDGSSREAEVFFHHKQGHRVPVSVRVSPLRDGGGAIVGGVELFSDISAKHAMLLRMKEMEQLALLDPLTRLSNRFHLEAELASRFQEMERYSLSFGVLFMDIDRFKAFNDRYGHGTGDLILKTVAETLRANARPFDVFGRWGGEEFLGIIRNVDALELEEMAQRCRHLVASTTIVVPEGLEGVTVSIGATLVQSRDTIDSLVKRADALMYRSKKAGRDCVTTDRNPRD